ncbi:hypothetical protein [Legionella fallonii]|uniref:Uncharacterized protein n=1 Tax=Legionella fallonii LLAP-10 TaxID=1212491 RepID=A0A098G2E9_9GAMM|nr:hypothetical protein [Legionella fallonii]CEG56159.1 protein of unknown function [Legionella fallonii LLAP-10]
MGTMVYHSFDLDGCFRNEVSAQALAITAAFGALVLAPTGIGLIVGMAVAGALALASIGTAIGAKHTWPKKLAISSMQSKR